jgi:hypothetical protein
MQNSTGKNKEKNFQTFAAIIGYIWACILTVVALFIIVRFGMVPTTIGLGPITFAQPTQTSAIANATSPSLAATPFQTQTLLVKDTPTVKIQSTSIRDVMPFVSTPVPPNPHNATPNPNNLIINGSFTNGFNGWIGKEQSETSEINIIPFENSNFGFALKLENQGKGGTSFSQDILIPSADVDFHATFSSKAEFGIFDGTSQSTISLVYFDGNGFKLGETIIRNIGGAEPNFHSNPNFAGILIYAYPPTPKDEQQTHYFPMKNDSLIEDFAINIKQVIDEFLLGIQSSQVVKMQIIISTKADSNHYSELIITDIMLLPH